MNHQCKRYKVTNVLGDWKLLTFTGNPNDVYEWKLPKGNIAPFTAADFNSCPFKEYMFEGAEVLAVCLNGSCALDATSETSDYDLNIYVKGGTREGTAGEKRMPTRFIYKGRLAHCYQDDFSLIDSLDKLQHLNDWQIQGLTEPPFNHILWVADTDEARAFVERGKELQETLIKQMCDMYCAWMHRYDAFSQFLTYSKDSWAQYGKALWMKYYCPAVSNGEAVDKDLIVALKGLRWYGLSNAYIEKMKTTLQTYIDNNKTPTKTTISKLEKAVLATWKKLWKGID